MIRARVDAKRIDASVRVETKKIDASKEVEIEKIEYEKWEKKHDDQQILIGFGIMVFIMVFSLIMSVILRGH